MKKRVLNRMDIYKIGVILLVFGLILIAVMIGRNTNDRNNSVHTEEETTFEPKYYDVIYDEEEEIFLVNVYREDSNGDIYITKEEYKPCINSQYVYSKEEWANEPRFKNNPDITEAVNKAIEKLKTLQDT